MPYRRLPSFVLGFHGTDSDTVNRLLSDSKSQLRPSQNKFDWLGNGVYFWENDPLRAFQYINEKFARDHKKGVNLDKKPAVIGAVIDLGLCLNMFDQVAIDELQVAYGFYLRFRMADAKAKNEELQPMPENIGGNDRLLRYLDRAVIEFLHTLRDIIPDTPAYDSVRAGFHEGDAAYPGAGFLCKNHIQLAVRNADCIKGFFLPRGVEFKPLEPAENFALAA